jgi:hypothetical protein
MSWTPGMAAAKPPTSAGRSYVTADEIAYGVIIASRLLNDPSAGRSTLDQRGADGEARRNLLDLLRREPDHRRLRPLRPDRSRPPGLLAQLLSVVRSRHL